MTFALVLLAVFVAMTIGGIILDIRSDWSDYGTGREAAAMASAVLGAVGVFIMLIIVSIAFFVPRHDRGVCEAFGEAAGRDTKFEHWSFWTWECLIDTDEGWVSRDNIVKVDD